MELLDWEAREQKFKKLFGNSVVDSKAFLKEKLAFYEVLDLRYSSKGPGSDKVGTQIIRQERRKLERKVFPNLLVRLAYKLIAAAFAKTQVVRAEMKQADNLKKVQARVMASGFDGMENIIAQKSAIGLKEFSIPVSEHLSERHKMDCELKFFKGGDGNYHFDGYQARLFDRERNEVNSCLVGPSTLKPDQAYNLLCGRPVIIPGDDQRPKWVQIDMNDKDDKGNLKIRNISREIGFDLAASLDKLPLKNAEEIKGNLLSQLQNGQQVSAVMELKGKEYPCKLVANPLHNEVAIFNGKMELVSAVDLKPKTGMVAGDTQEMEKVNRKQMKVAR